MLVVKVHWKQKEFLIASQKTLQGIARATLYRKGRGMGKCSTSHKACLISSWDDVDRLITVCFFFVKSTFHMLDDLFERRSVNRVCQSTALK